MTETDTPLPDREPDRIAVAVEIDANQFLFRAGRRALLPESPASRPVHATARVDRAAEARRVRPGQAHRRTRFVAHHRRPQPVRTVASKQASDDLRGIEPTFIERASDLDVDADPVERRDLLHRPRPARGHQPSITDQPPQTRRTFQVQPRAGALVLDERRQESGHERTKPFDPRLHGVTGPPTPPSINHLAVPGIHRGDHAVTGKRGQKFRGRGGADHHLARACIEPTNRRRPVADSTTDPAPASATESFDDLPVVTLADRRVEVDDRDLAESGETVHVHERISTIEQELPSLPPLDGASL